MKIAIMSDSHDMWENLEKAVQIANERECEMLLYAGDLIAPPGLAVLEKFGGKVKFVWGNNEGERVGMTRAMDASEKIELSGDVFEEKIGEVRVFMNHYPWAAELAAKSGEFDLAIHGHTHDYRSEMVGECLLVNPGEVQGYKNGEPGFVIYNTDSKKAERVLI